MYKDCYTTNKLAKLLNVSQALVLKWLKEGTLRSLPLPSKRHKIPVPFIIDFLKHHQMPIPEELQAAEAPAVATRKEEHATIMMIDDDQGVIEIIKESLKTAPFEHRFHAFLSGIEALLEIDAIQPQLVLLDLEMPEINGFEMCRRLNSRFPDLKIIILTGHTEEEYLNKLHGNSYNELITKPIRIKPFLKTVQNLLLS